MKNVFTDERWKGKHGIGRYASEVLVRIPDIQPLGLGGKPLSLFDPFFLRSKLQQCKSQFFYNPGFNAPLRWNGISLLTIHDLIHLDDPSQASYLKKQYYHFVIRPEIERAPFVFTVSNASKKRVMEWLNLDKDRVIVTPNGVSTAFRFSEVSPSDEDYFLYVGTSRSHKNTERMLKAFAALNERSLRLKWLGPISTEDQHLIYKLNLTDRVDFLSNLTDQKLAQIYAQAKGTLLISTMEGFGLPPLESIFCGTPALISEDNPIAGDLGDLAITANAYEIDDITEKMGFLRKKPRFTKTELDQIHQLRQFFNWDNTAAIVNKALQGLQ